MENGVSPVYLAAQESGTSTFLTVILTYLKGQNHEMHTFLICTMKRRWNLEEGKCVPDKRDLCARGV
jgi:hypothetical protein